MIRMNNQFATIVESGSNDNGSYIKYSDGTMMCYHTILPNEQNTIYHYSYSFWTFPMSFIDNPYIYCTPKEWGTAMISVKTYIKDVYSARLMVHMLTLSSGVQVYDGTCEINVLAIGKWK